jgi:adenylate kinase family enzyme
MTNTIDSATLARITEWIGSGSINIFGLPFAGKDTHGHHLAELLHAPLLSSGQVFRDSRNLLSAEDQQILDTGGLPPSDVFLKLFTPYFRKDEYAGKPLILSSVGRWVGEEQGVLQAAQDSNHPIKAVIYLHLSEHLVYERLRASQQIGDRTRPEDSEEHIQTRLDEFNNKTLPAIEEYRKLGLLIEVNSDAAKEEVFESIIARLFMKASASN